MEFASFVLCTVICLSILIPVSAAPSERSTAHEKNANRKELLNYEKQPEDKDVLELQSLKSPKDLSMSTTKVQKTLYTNANGEKEENVQSTKQISNNGELMERIRENVRTTQQFGSSQPEKHIITEIEIPPKNIHKLYEENIPGLRELSKKNIETGYRYADNRKPDNVLQNFDDMVYYQPEEMAKYIYETGDEKSVTNTIETYIQLGVITREEALWYLQQIKALLSMLEEQEIRDKKREQSRFYDNPYYSSLKGRMNMNEAPLDVREVQHLIQEKYMKQYPEDNVNYRYNSDEVISEETDTFEKEFEKAKYPNSAEKLQNFDSFFSKASMEGVIYQLAKILFYQSFSMNGLEAQRPIKQITRFLDKQVEENHISRNMERKVFDILSSALTDTLDEHPELIGEKNIDQNRKIRNPQLYLLKHTVEKKNGKSKETSYHATKSINLISSGILDEPKNLTQVN